MSEEKLVNISESRLLKLEALELAKAVEASMPTRMTIQEYHAERFKMLRERDKAHPEKHVRRTMVWYTKNKEAINAKRREKRRLEKEAREKAKIGDTQGI